MKEISEEIKAILNRLPDPLLLIDGNQKVIWYNRQATLMFKHALESGPSLETVTGSKKAVELADRVLDGKLPEEFSPDETAVKISQDGEDYTFRIAVIPINEHCAQGAAVLFTDITPFQTMDINTMGGDFVSIISHEFRTPLTTIIVGVEMLLKGMLGDLTPRGKEIVDAIQGDCRRLTRLAENLMDLSRADSGKISIETEPVDAANLVQEAVRPLKIQARNKGVDLIIKLPPDLPPIEADFNKSIWVLTNLIGNALRYTEKGGSITIEVLHNKDRLFFSVCDTGCGIPKSYQGKVFSKYVQVKGQDQNKRGGAGLGLAIAKDIVIALGGEIWVESEEGKGSTFTFTLPVLQPDESGIKGGDPHESQSITSGR